MFQKFFLVQAMGLSTLPDLHRFVRFAEDGDLLQRRARLFDVVPSKKGPRRDIRSVFEFPWVRQESSNLCDDDGIQVHLFTCPHSTRTAMPGGKGKTVRSMKSRLTAPAAKVRGTSAACGGLWRVSGPDPAARPCTMKFRKV